MRPNNSNRIWFVTAAIGFASGMSFGGFMILLSIGDELKTAQGLEQASLVFHSRTEEELREQTEALEKVLSSMQAAHEVMSRLVATTDPDWRARADLLARVQALEHQSK